MNEEHVHTRFEARFKVICSVIRILGLACSLASSIHLDDKRYCAWIIAFGGLVDLIILLSGCRNEFIYVGNFDWYLLAVDFHIDLHLRMFKDNRGLAGLTAGGIYFCFNRATIVNIVLDCTSSLFRSIRRIYEM